MSKESEVKYIGINPERTAFVIGTNKGIIAYDLYPLRRKFSVVFEKGWGVGLESNEEFTAVELVSNTNYVVIANNISSANLSNSSSSSSSIKSEASNLIVYDAHNAKYISLRTIYGCITCMKVLYDPAIPKNSKLCVGTKDCVLIYGIHSSNPPQQVVPCTPRSLSISVPPGSRKAFLVTENGKEVVIFDMLGKETIRITLNRNNNSRMSAVSFTGRFVASASEAGTVIKVKDLIHQEAAVLELRRGTSNCAVITSMSFSADDSLLAVSTDRETVHIFAVAPELQPQQGWVGWVTGAATVDSIIKISPPVSDPPNSPDAVTFGGCVVSFLRKDDSRELVVVTRRGDYLVYDIDARAKTAKIKDGTRPVNLATLEL